MDFLDIFQIILRSSLIGSIIVLMILIIKGIFRNKLNATFHYYVWLILLIKLIIPFGPQTPLTISNIHKNFYVQSTTNQNTQENKNNSSQQFQNKNFGDSTSISDFQPPNKNVINNTKNIPLKNKISIEKLFCFIWMLGVVLLIVRLIVGYIKLREIVKVSVKNINSAHKEILYNCMKAMNIRTEVELLYSQQISSPSLNGFFKPKILIPVNLAGKISDEEFTYIIMHELTHLKNKDIVINWVITLLSMIYWFNPILLYSFHKMRQDCELSCDAQVISYLNEGENLKYGNALIRVLELGGNSKRLMGTTSMVMNSSEIKRRIIMISKYKKLNIKGILLGVVVAVIIAGLGITLNTSKVRADKNIAKKTPAAISKNAVNNISNETVAPITKTSTSDSAKSTVPFLPDIVIYNTHADEAYPSGMKVTDVGTLINDKLLKEGLNSHFIKCDPPTDGIKAYQTSRDLITKNVQGYSNTILLDIHREVVPNTKTDRKTIIFTLAKSNPHYEANKKFVDSLVEDIQNSNQVKSGLYFYNVGINYFNQDLSNNSVLIELGNNMSSDSDIEACVNALVSALKNIQKGSSN